jgi:hypothetical protein
MHIDIELVFDAFRGEHALWRFMSHSPFVSRIEI